MLAAKTACYAKSWGAESAFFREIRECIGPTPMWQAGRQHNEASTRPGLGVTSYIKPRVISDAELGVLQVVMLRAGTAQLPEIRADELKKLVVYSKCDCGCASVGFLPEGTEPSENTKPIADGLGLSSDNKQVGVIVHGSPGQFVELEIYWHYEGGAPLPRPETIVPWERGTEVAEAAP